MKQDRKYVGFTLGVVFPAVFLIWGLWHVPTLWAALIKLIRVCAPLIIGCVIAFVINIPMTFFEDKVLSGLKEKKLVVARTLSIIISCLFIIGVLTLLMLIIIPEVIETIKNLSGSVVNAINSAYSWVVVQLAEFDITLDSTLITKQEFNSITSYVEKVFTNATSVITGAVGVASSVISGFFNFLLGLFIAFYMLFGKEKIQDFGKKLCLACFSAEPCNKFFRILSLTNASFKNFVSGQVTEGVVLGSLCFIGMSIFRFPYAMTISAIIGFCALIPIVGAFCGAALGALLCLTVSPLRALLFIIYLTILQQIDNNFVYPRIVGKSVGIPGLLVLVSVTIGGSLLGVTGMLCAVPVTAVIYVLTNEFVTSKLGKVEAEEEELKEMAEEKAAE